MSSLHDDDIQTRRLSKDKPRFAADDDTDDQDVDADDADSDTDDADA
jgi:hypothetical protein